MPSPNARGWSRPMRTTDNERHSPQRQRFHTFAVGTAGLRM
jgi:hypothetical protein